jgi:flagellar biosynthetic protein FliR
MRLIAGLAISLALAPALPPLPAIPAGSWLGLTVIVEQILIGVMMGFALRIAFAALDVAGELIGLQMGLSFATFFDPAAAARHR